MSLSGITVMNVGLVSELLFPALVTVSVSQQFGKCFKNQESFLEAGSGFHGNAFRNWGETQLHSLGCGTAGEGCGVQS